MKEALDAEREHLVNIFGISGDEFHFVDGSGGGESSVTTKATIKLLNDMSKTEVFDAYKASLPVLGVDGSLVFVDGFEKIVILRTPGEMFLPRLAHPSRQMTVVVL